LALYQVSAHEHKQESIENTRKKGYHYPKMLYLNTVKAVATGHYERTNNMASNWEPETFLERRPINTEITQ